MKPFLLLSLIVLSACSMPVKTDPCGDCGGLEPELVMVFDLVNEARSAARACGTSTFPAVPALKLNNQLTRAAQKHSEDMQASGVMSHASPAGAQHYAPGTSFDKRITQEGYSFSSASENIAFGYPTAEDVMQGWLESPGHCKNIMSADVSEVGRGHQAGYWTQDFARPLKP